MVLGKEESSLSITEEVRKKIDRLRSERGKNSAFLRLKVKPGGCYGFEYALDLEETAKADDILVGGLVLVDKVSFPLVRGSTITFVDELIGSDFKVINPNAGGGCGCGASFSLPDDILE